MDRPLVFHPPLKQDDPMHTGLEGKVVVVTGASGGIGSAIARKLAGEGAQLVLHYRTGRDRAEALASELGTASLLVRGQLEREADARRLMAATIRRFGRVDTLVVNAGSWAPESAGIADISLKRWRGTMDAVLTTAFLSLREFARVVRRQRRGNAVLVASTAGIFGEAGQSDYAAAKAAMAHGLVKSLKNEFARLAPHTADYCGGRVNAVCPGWTVVPRNASKLADADMVRRVTATMALPQIGRPDDMANAVVYLASDVLARHVTGQAWVVAGGMEGRLLWEPGEVEPGWA
jgi:3-oxoacyl-[acyl-carrier protein] reductase